MADEMGQIVVVNELGIAKNPRLLPEKMLDIFSMLLNLRPKLLARIQKRQRVVISLVQKLHAPRLIQRVKRIHHLGAIQGKLLQSHPGNRIRNPKPPLMNPNRLQQSIVRRQITLVRHLPTDLRVLVLVKVMPVRIKNAIPAKPKGLMNLKIETNGSHISLARQYTRSAKGIHARDGAQKWPITNT
jgi:hypothetical protein